MKSNKFSIITSDNQGFLSTRVKPGITPINHRCHFLRKFADLGFQSSFVDLGFQSSFVAKKMSF